MKLVAVAVAAAFFLSSSTALAPPARLTTTAAATTTTTTTTTTTNSTPFSSSRRSLLGKAGAFLAVALPTTAARADPLQELAAIGGWVDSAGKAPSGKQQILNEDSGEYADRDQDESWQGTWKSRLDKASGMSPDEILMAARGGGNTEQKEGPESPASAKRRAMAGCRIEGIRKKDGMPDEKACAARVLKGDPDFMLDVLDAGKPQRSAQAEPAPVALPADPARETAPAPAPAPVASEESTTAPVSAAASAPAAIEL